jgi:electron transfer flavoprotein beta subunit
MNIVACVKRVPLTDVAVKPAADGASLDTTGLEYSLSFYDDLAVEAAIQTKEKHGGEVTVLKALILKDAAWGARDPRSTAKALAAKVRELGAQVVFCGRVATDRDNSAVGPMLATHLGWACVTDVIALELAADKGTARRETEAGVETLEFSLPAVITCDKGLNEPRYAGLKGIMAAKKKPIDEQELAAEPAQAVSTRLELPPPRKEGRIVGEGAAAVPALIEALRKEAQAL